jgi:hypothetical protein
LTISLSNDSNGNITGATYTVLDRENVTQAEVPLSILQIAPSTNIAPIIAFELNLVGPDNGQTTTLSSGGGTITYAASHPLTVASVLPSQVETPNVITAETANSFYGTLPAGPSADFTQSFTVSGVHPMIRRAGTHDLRR